MPLCRQETSSEIEIQLTTGYTIEGIVRQDTWNVRRSSPNEEHDGRSEGEENQSVDGPDLLSRDEGKDTT
jgi:hypothetical protein